MNSFAELNAVGASVIEVDDTRDATVIFDKDTRYFDPDQLVVYTSNVITFTPSINIEEIINYATANARFRVEIITSGADPGTISFATMPTGLTLTQAGTVYTITGIKDSVQWDTISTFTWTMPAGYASERLYYLKLSILYYDESTSSEKVLDWYYYDEAFYYNFYQNIVFNNSVTYTRIRPSASTMTSNFVLTSILPSFVKSKFVLTAQGEPTSICTMSTSMSLTATSTIPRFGTSTLTTRFVNTANTSLGAFVTLTDDANYTYLQQGILSEDLSTFIVLGYKTSTSQWGLLYYDFSRTNLTLTFNSFIAIESAPIATHTPTGRSQPNPLLSMTAERTYGLVTTVTNNIETSSDGEMTTLNCLLTNSDGTTIVSKIYTVKRSTQNVVSNASTSTNTIFHPTISRDGLRRAYVGRGTGNLARFIVVDTSTNTTVGTRTIPATSDSFGTYFLNPTIQYETINSRYWLGNIIHSNSINGNKAWYVSFHDSTNFSSEQNLIALFDPGTPTLNLPSDIRFDTTGTYFAVVRGVAYDNSTLEVYTLSGTTWSLSRTFNLASITPGNASNCQMSILHVSSNAKRIFLKLQTSTTPTYSYILLNWNGSSYTSSVYASADFLDDNLICLSASDRYVAFQRDWSWSGLTRTPGYVKIYKF